MSVREPGLRAVVIRAALTKDAADIVSLLYESFAEYRALYTVAGFAATAIAPAEVIERMREGPLLVATVNEKIIGTVAMVRTGDSLYIRGMAVHPAARGQHVGEQLLSRVENFAIRHKIRRMFLSTTPFLERAIKLYEHFGFRRVDEESHDLFGPPLFTMEKHLDETDQ